MEDRFLHHRISSARVVVENVIAGVKRCRIVKDVLRLTTEASLISLWRLRAACTISACVVVTRSPHSMC